MTRQVIKLDEARRLTPRIDDVASCVMRLNSAIFDAVSEADITKIVEGVKAKALAGDLKAARFLLDMVAAPKVQYTRRDSYVVTENRRGNARVVDAEEIDDVDADPVPTALHSRIALALSKGPIAADDLAGVLGEHADQVAAALESPGVWFRENGRQQWQLTRAGRGRLL